MGMNDFSGPESNITASLITEKDFQLLYTEPRESILTNSNQRYHRYQLIYRIIARILYFTQSYD